MTEVQPVFNKHCVSCHDYGAAPMISFDRPERSPILNGLETRNPAAHREALAIIRAGRDALAAKPRADMPGFVACETDRKRQDKYDRLWSNQLRARAAVAAGKKVYDR